VQHPKASSSAWQALKKGFENNDKTTIKFYHMDSSLITNILFTSFIPLKEAVLEIHTGPRMNNENYHRHRRTLAI